MEQHDGGPATVDWSNDLSSGSCHFVIMSTQAQSQQGGVGALLKQSREQRGLTTAEVASQLRLKVSQIEQIEAEQWDPSVSATFIRGYLRSSSVAKMIFYRVMGF